jgi:hypothetical protein
LEERLMIEEEEGWTRPIKSKKNTKLVTCLASSTLVAMVIAGSLGFAWADTGVDSSGIAIKATDAIKNDPAAMKVLENIEWFKQRWALLQTQQELQDQQNKLIDEQRALAKASLQNDLDRMSNAKDQTTAQNAFANFVSTVNSPAHSVFSDEFNYMQTKVQQAREARNQVLQNGGTMEEAILAFNDAASFHKNELVGVNNVLNVKYHLADQNVQNLFDKWGNIPRN